MKKLTKVFAVLLAVTMVFTLFACAKKDSDGETSAAGGDAKKFKIAIIQPMEHLSLNEIRDTIVLKALGYTDDKAEIILKNANGDMSLLPSIYNNLITEKVDIYVPIATPTAQAAKAAVSDKPLFSPQ